MMYRYRRFVGVLLPFLLNGSVSLLTAGSPIQVNGVMQATLAAGGPTITWSMPEIATTLFPGIGSNAILRFQSDLDLEGVLVEPSSSLDGVVSVSPTVFSSVVAGRSYEIRLDLKAPSVFKKRVFGGTILLRDAKNTSRAYPQPFNVKVSIEWSELTVGEVFAVNYPATWNARQHANTVTLSSTSELPMLEGDSGNELLIIALPINGASSIDTWLHDYYAGEMNWGQTPIVQYTNPNGISFKIVRSTPALSSDNISAYTILNDKVMHLSVTPASKYGSLFSSVLSSFRPR